MNRLSVGEVGSSPRFSRVWAMPSSNTFTVAPIGEFVQRYLAQSALSIDPFARDNGWATYTNDLNPSTQAMHHMDAEAFLEHMSRLGLNGKIDLAILDPPYSPRQVSEAYRAAGLTAGMTDTQNAALYARVRAALLPLLAPDAIVLSFGWNSAGMGADGDSARRSRRSSQRHDLPGGTTLMSHTERELSDEEIVEGLHTVWKRAMPKQRPLAERVADRQFRVLPEAVSDEEPCTFPNCGHKDVTECGQ